MILVENVICEDNFSDIWESLWKCQSKYLKIFSTNFISRQLKSENQAKTRFAWEIKLCNRMFYCILGWYFLSKCGWNKKNFNVVAKIFFSCLTPLFTCLLLGKTVRLGHNISQNVTNFFLLFCIKKVWKTSCFQFLETIVYLVFHKAIVSRIKWWTQIMSEQCVWL